MKKTISNLLCCLGLVSLSAAWATTNETQHQLNVLSLNLREGQIPDQYGSQADLRVPY